jgi:hypothetical protein
VPGDSVTTAYRLKRLPKVSPAFFAAFGYKGIAAISMFLVLGIYMTVSFLLAGQKHGFRNN